MSRKRYIRTLKTLHQTLKTLFLNFENVIFGKKSLSAEKTKGGPFGLPSTFGSINEKRYIRNWLYPVCVKSGLRQKIQRGTLF